MSTPQPDADLEALLEFLKQTRGFDFTSYKRPSLMRRITKRMHAVNIQSFGEYQGYLETNPPEYAQLFDTILINVTSFNRDPAAWDFLATEIIPRILAGKKPGEAIRIWSAGCASGQEAYTVAVLLAENIGLEEFRHRVKIYATDADEAALTQARQAAYTERDLRDLPEVMRTRYFQSVNGQYVVHPDLRRAAVFGRIDLLQDAPISRLDLLICRNTLMYFNAEAQSRILSRFHFSLNEGGFLFLGKSEALLAHSHLFNPVHAKLRIFAKRPAEVAQQRDQDLPRDDQEDREVLARGIRLRELTFDALPLAQIALDGAGNLAMANRAAQAMFGLLPASFGRSFAEFELSYRPAELRARIEQACSERRIVKLAGTIRRLPGGEEQVLDIDVIPLPAEGEPAGVCITFADVTHHAKLHTEYQRSRQELDTVREELQATNEELQSANEELQTTNEELQSSNEELETTNEELQCANAELEAVADQGLRRLVAVLRDSNDAITIQDLNGRIEAWNHGAELMYGYTEAEAKGLDALDLVPPERREELRGLLESLRHGERLTSFETQRVTKDGRVLDVLLTLTPQVNPEGRLISFATTERDITERNRAAASLQESNAELERKNAELEQLFYTVSHDLKSPLVTIRGFLGHLRRDAESGHLGHLEDHTRRIENAAARMAMLLDDLLDFSRIGRIMNEPTRINLTGVVREIVDVHAEELATAKISMEIQKDMPVLLGDRARICQVLDNLLVNAIKYGSDAIESRIAIGGRQDADEIRVFVRDNGNGIPPAFHDKIFKLFQRLQSDGSGVGVGLAIVKRIVEAHGGRVWVESQPGEGATFWLTFPVHAKPITDESPANEPSSSRPSTLQASANRPPR